MKMAMTMIAMRRTKMTKLKICKAGHQLWILKTIGDRTYLVVIQKGK